MIFKRNINNREQKFKIQNKETLNNNKTSNKINNNYCRKIK